MASKLDLDSGLLEDEEQEEGEKGRPLKMAGYPHHEEEGGKKEKANRSATTRLATPKRASTICTRAQDMSRQGGGAESQVEISQHRGQKSAQIHGSHYGGSRPPPRTHTQTDIQTDSVRLSCCCSNQT